MLGEKSCKEPYTTRDDSMTAQEKNDSKLEEVRLGVLDCTGQELQSACQGHNRKSLASRVGFIRNLCRCVGGLFCPDHPEKLFESFVQSLRSYICQCQVPGLSNLGRSDLRGSV